MKAGDVLDMEPLGLRIEFLRTAAETGGELVEAEVTGREHVLSAGQSIQMPPGTPHTQELIRPGSGRVRIAVPSLGVQRAIARAVLTLGRPKRPYLFVDEWDVAASPEAVFDAVADSRTYPEWWRSVYVDVEADGPAALGAAASHHFKGRLPYHLRIRSVVVDIDPPRRVVADVDGDLRGRGTWTLTPAPNGTHVRFDWQVHADRALLRVLTPVLRPLLRWNHNWAIARAKEGLEPFAQSARRRYDAPAGVA